MVTSFYEASSDRWTTVVLAAADGRERASIARGPFLGTAELTGGDRAEILVEGTGVLRFTGSALEVMAEAPGVSPVFVRDEATHRRASSRQRLLSLDVNGDDVPELIAVRAQDNRQTLLALSVAGGEAREVASTTFEPEVRLLTFEVFAGVTRDGPQILLARSDGYLQVLDGSLTPTNASVGGEFGLRGLRIGGYYSGLRSIGGAPVAADLDGRPGAEILVRDSRGVLLRLRAEQANLTRPPLVDFEVPGAALPTLADVDADGLPEIFVGLRGERDVVRALAASGETLWEVPVGTDARALTHDLAPGDLSGDGVPDLVYQLFDRSTGRAHINAINGATRERTWASDYSAVVAGGGLGANALYDQDRNDRLDVLACINDSFVWLRDNDGAPTLQRVAGWPRHPTLEDVVGDASPEIFSSGAVFGVTRLNLGLEPASSNGMARHTGHMGALARCPAGPRWVQSVFNEPRLTLLDAASLEEVASLRLSGGALRGSGEEASGVLGNVTISPDLDGSGGPAALVGSTDGHLYAVDPCAGTLLWALDFRYPVGEAILADTDGDDLDEIVVTVADGYLYGVDQEVFAKPALVVDLAAPQASATAADDVDEVAASDGVLHAYWSAVEGAMGYEYAVVTPGGAFLTEPNFIGVGTQTQATTQALPLTLGARYQFAVRAIGEAGASSEALSDGVLVVAGSCDRCAPDERCVDGTCAPGPCSGVVCEGRERCVAGRCEEPGAVSDGGVGDPSEGLESSGGCCSVAGGAPLRPLEGLALGAFGLALVWRRWRR